MRITITVEGKYLGEYFEEIELPDEDVVGLVDESSGSDVVAAIQRSREQATGYVTQLAHQMGARMTAAPRPVFEDVEAAE